MARIIDLKNIRPGEYKPENGEELDLKQDVPVQEAGSRRREARVISWSGHQNHQSSTKAVLFATIMLFAIAILIQVFQDNIITTIFFALLGTVILLNANKKTGGGKFEINPTGVKIDNHLHRFGDLKSFWIEYDPTLGIKELSLQTEKWYLPYVKIPIDDQNPVQMRLALLEFLPEVEHKDTLVEILARKLGI